MPTWCFSWSTRAPASTPLDRHFAQVLRRSAKPVIVAANKAESSAFAGAHEAFALGLGDPIAISAEHGEGLDALFRALAPFADRIAALEPRADKEKPLQLAIVGRPNVGKSTLVNRLLGEERMLTGAEPGVTRDAIASAWQWRGRAIRLIDTAGLRRKAGITEKLEKLSVGDTLRAIRFAEVVVLLVDATQALERQDLTIARLVADEGRALVLAVNKWDLVREREKRLKELRETCQRLLPQVKGVSLVPVSALGGAGLDRLMQSVIDVDRLWNTEAPDPRAEPMAARRHRCSCAAGSLGATRQAQIHHAGQCPSADFCGFLLAA